MIENDEEPLARHIMGEGFVICEECGARLASFDLVEGQMEDISKKCPYKCK